MSSSPDIIVIGAGVVGCAVAYELARRGRSVQVHDERTTGFGATQASAGMLAPYLEAEGPGALLDLTARSLDLFDDLVERAATDSRQRVPYRRCGTLQVVGSDGLAALRATAARLAASGVETTLLDAEGAHREEPHLGQDVGGGLVVHTHGYVGAAELTSALAASARRLGGQIVEHSRVARIRATGGRLLVETGRGPLRATTVVLAAGSWSPQIDLEGVRAAAPVRPIRGQLLRLAWTGQPVRRVIWSDRCYIVPWDDGTVLVGATVEDAGFDERTTVAGVRDLMDAACDVLPHAWSAGFQSARVGLRPATPDELPIIGWSRAMPGLMYATGHYRNGILLAPLTASLVADAIVDGREDPALALVSPQRFGAL